MNVRKGLIITIATVGWITGHTAINSEASGDTILLSVNDHVVAPLDVVQIENAKSSQSSWIAIFEVDDSRKRLRLLGKTALTAGDNSGISVRLSREVRDGEVLQAVLHRNVGALDEFEFPGRDVILADQAGKPIAKNFIVRHPIIAPGPGLPLEPKLPLLISPNSQSTVTLTKKVSDEDLDGAAYTFICIPVDCDLQDVAVQVSLQHISGGEIVGRLVVPYHGDARGRPIKLFSSKRPQTINQTFRFSELGNREGVQAASLMRDGIRSRSWWVFELLPTSQDASARLDDVKLFLTCKGKTPDWPKIVPHVQADDQYVRSGVAVVVIDTVVSDGPGWIVLYDDDGAGPEQSMYYRHLAAPGGPNKIVGFTRVNSGINHDVVVNLNKNIRNRQTLYAFLNSDKGEIGKFEYSGDAKIDNQVTDLVDPRMKVHAWFYVEPEITKAEVSPATMRGGVPE